MFCDKALPLINENAFADMYHESQGAPNKSVTLLFGLLILKDMFDFTDEQTWPSLSVALFYRG
jgi:hypothetical protein